MLQSKRVLLIAIQWYLSRESGWKKVKMCEAAVSPAIERHPPICICLCAISPPVAPKVSECLKLSESESLDSNSSLDCGCMQVGLRMSTGGLGSKLELEVQAPEVGFGKEEKVVVGVSNLGLSCRCRSCAKNRLLRGGLAKSVSRVAWKGGAVKDCHSAT
jgi:hypothetical protein